MSAQPPNSSQQRSVSPTASTSQHPYGSAAAQGQQGPVRSGSLSSNSNGAQQRTRPSMTSSGSSGSVQTSHMESTITRLLVATKQLLEGLGKWSRGEIGEDQISEIYVKLGNDFNVACAAFAKENIGMNELLSVPSDLRVCLETCLSETPSQATLERHLPKVRQIIIGLLHGLREKQRLYRDGAAARRGREREEMERRASAASASGGAPAMHQQRSGQGAPVRDPLTPNSANRSRDELRKFVTQAKASAPPTLPPTAPPPAPSSSSRSVSQPAYPSSTSSSSASLGAPADSTANIPASTSSSSTSSFVSSSTSGGRYDDAPASSSSGSIVKQSTRSSAVPLPPNSRTGSKSASGPSSIGVGGGSLRDRDRGERDQPTRQGRSVSESIETGNAPTFSGLPHSRSSTSLAGSLGNLSTTSSSTVTSQFQRPASVERTRTYSPPPPPREPEEIPLTPPFPSSASAGTLQQQQQQAMSVACADNPPGSSSSLSNNPPLTEESTVSPTLESVSQSAAQIQSLEALKASDNLSRRASKRYSAYTIQKMTGTSTGSPLRGGDGASRSGMTRGERLARGSEELRRASSSAGKELADGDRRGSTSKSDAPRRTKSEFRPMRGPDGERRPAPPPLPAIPSSLSAQTLTGLGVGTIMEQEESSTSAEGSPEMSRQGSGGPPNAALPPLPNSTSSIPTSFTPPASIDQIVSAPAIPSHIPQSARSSVSSPSEPSFPLTIFIQLGRDVKKARLDSAPTHASLRMLFIQRFQYNPGSSGEFPAIYVRDRDAGVHYELEDLGDVRESSVLSLNIDDVQQVKNHIDQGLSALAQEMKELRTTVTAMRRVSVSANTLFSPQPDHTASPAMRPSPSERQFQDAAHKVIKMRKLASTNALASPSLEEPPSPKSTDVPASTTLPPPIATTLPPPSATGVDPDSLISPTRSSSGDAYVAQLVGTLKTQHAEVQKLRHELGVLRQVYVDFATQTKEAMASVRVQTSHVATIAGKKLSGDRQFVEAGIAKFDIDSQDLVMRVDELSDLVDTIRNDTIKGIRARPQQLNDLNARVVQAFRDHERVQAWALKSKSVWGTTWSDELQRVIQEQDTVTSHEALMRDITADLGDINSVLMDIMSVSKKAEKGGNTTRQAKALEFGGGASNLRHVEGSTTGSEDGGTPDFLLEVKGLRVDPEKRLEAIAKAEKARELELASRTDEFADELGGFVSGGKLKKSGGIEETERLRQLKSEATLKAMFAG